MIDFRGKFIVIGGNDSTGKATQTEMLASRINQETRSQIAYKLSFPVYDSFWGNLIGRYLSKPEFGDPLPEEVCSDPLQAAMLYELDRVAQAPNMRKQLASGRCAVGDRYAESNLAHQGGRITGENDRNNFIGHLVNIQSELQIPVPDLTLILTLNDNIRSKRAEERRGAGLVAGKSSAIDRHEQNSAYMTAVNQLYPQLADRFNWPIIPCDNGTDQLTPDEIHNLIWQKIQECFS